MLWQSSRNCNNQCSARILVSGNQWIRWQEPGKALVGKLCAHVRPKCHPLLLDTSINSPATVRLNLFQIMLLAAMKLHCQVQRPSLIM